MSATAVVAGLSIDAVSADGDAFTIELEIGTPYQCDTGEWACPLALRGLHDRLSDARGIDPFQALCMASALALTHLQDFTINGGLLPDFQIDAYAFGAAIRRSAY